MYHIKNHCLALENTRNQFDKAKNSRCTISCPAKRECDIFVVFSSVVCASCNCANFHRFFFDCDKYTDYREILFNSLN